MNKVEKPLKKDIYSCILPIIGLLAAVMVCAIYIVTSHNTVIKSYAVGYNDIAQMSASLECYEQSLNDYIEYGSEEHKEELKNDYNTLNYKSRNLYFNRYDYVEDVRDEIENIGVLVDSLAGSMSKVFDENDMKTVAMIYSDNIDGSISQIRSDIAKVMEIQVLSTESKYNMISNVSVVCLLVIITMLVTLIALTVKFYAFVKSRITVPAKEIAEWAKLMGEDYYQMSPLKYGEQDEIQQIAEAFNIVKEKIIEHQQKNEELGEIVRKLRNEEESKKKFVQMLYEEKREKASITSAAQKDGLTGLYNRKAFDDIVNDFVAKKPNNKEGALFIIDMDNFKTVNDSLGHLQGDEALKMLAGSMRVVFAGAYLGRYGGDEFVAFVVDCVRDDDICKVAGELCSRMRRTIENNGKSVKISVSIGCATSIGTNLGNELYSKADKALYHSKENGRDQFTIYTDEFEGVVYDKG